MTFIYLFGGVYPECYLFFFITIGFNNMEVVHNSCLYVGKVNALNWCK